MTEANCLCHKILFHRSSTVDAVQKIIDKEKEDIVVLSSTGQVIYATGNVEEIVDEKIKSIEQKQQEDFENIKAESRYLICQDGLAWRTGVFSGHKVH